MCVATMSGYSFGGSQTAASCENQVGYPSKFWSFTSDDTGRTPHGSLPVSPRPSTPFSPVCTPPGSPPGTPHGSPTLAFGPDCLETPEREAPPRKKRRLQWETPVDTQTKKPPVDEKILLQLILFNSKIIQLIGVLTSLVKESLANKDNYNATRYHAILVLNLKLDEDQTAEIDRMKNTRTLN